MREAKFFEEMKSLSYRVDEEYDKLCAPFADVVRACGKKDGLDWEDTVDNKIARILLCDQLARNCFRGTDEAFAYDHISLAHTKELVHHALHPSEDVSFRGEIYGFYGYVCAIVLMHSEDAKDHELSLDFLEWCKSTTGNIPWNAIKGFELEHKAVIDRFGRYPHRNKAKHRKSTKEEEDFLADVDNLPRWAKSQI